MAQLETIGCLMLDVGCWMFSLGSRIFRGILSMTPWEHRTSNIQHPTSNRQSMAQLETIGCWMLDVGCWMFSFGSWKGRKCVSENLCRKGANLRHYITMK